MYAHSKAPVQDACRPKIQTRLAGQKAEPDKDDYKINFVRKIKQNVCKRL